MKEKLILQNILKIMLAKFIETLKDNSGWIKMIFFIFAISFVGGVITFFNPEVSIFSFMIREGLNNLSEIGERLLDANFWEKAWVIFKNNIVVATVMLFGGIVLGILPLFIIIFNGVFLGYFLTALLFSPLLFFDKAVLLFTLIPHAVIELGAIFLAAAFGLKLGLNYIITKERRRLRVFLKDVVFSLKLYKFVVVMLLLAAVVEVVDAWIIELLVK